MELYYIFALIIVGIYIILLIFAPNVQDRTVEFFQWIAGLFRGQETPEGEESDPNRGRNRAQFWTSLLVPTAIGVMLWFIHPEFITKIGFWIFIAMLYIGGIAMWAWNKERPTHVVFYACACIILIATALFNHEWSDGYTGGNTASAASTYQEPIAILDAQRGDPEDPEGWSETVFREWPFEYDRVHANGYDVWMEALNGDGKRIGLWRIKDAEDVHISSSSAHVRYKVCADQPGDETLKIYRN